MSMAPGVGLGAPQGLQPKAFRDICVCHTCVVWEQGAGEG